MSWELCPENVEDLVKAAEVCSNDDAHAASVSTENKEFVVRSLAEIAELQRSDTDVGQLYV